MNYNIDNISIAKIIWLEIKNNRVSFSFEGLPKDIHFTLAWNKSGKINLHITKNIGDGKNKPKIVIVRFDSQFVDQFSTIIFPLIFNIMFEPVFFNKYPRSSRKNIRFLFLDELERDNYTGIVEKKMGEIWQKVSTIKKNKVKVQESFHKEFYDYTTTNFFKSFALGMLRAPKKNLFKSSIFRGGIVFIGDKSYPFISQYSYCYVAKKKLTIYNVLCAISNPELAQSLINYVKDALEKISSMQTWQDSEEHSNPYNLYMENVG